LPLAGGLCSLAAHIRTLDLAQLPPRLTILAASGVLRVLDSRAAPPQQPGGQQQQQQQQRQGEAGRSAPQAPPGSAPQLRSLTLDASRLQLGEQQRPPLRVLLPCLGQLRSLYLTGSAGQAADGLQLLTSLQDLHLEEVAGGLAPLLAPLAQLTSLAFGGVGSKSSQGRVLEAVAPLVQLRRLQARPSLVPWRSKPLRALRAALPRCELLVEPQAALQLE
jgi:hypothetical protein